MKSFGLIPILFFGLCAYANKPNCFEAKQDLIIPGTKYTMTLRGEIRNGNQKFANLPLPKGFLGECVVASSYKTTDTLAVLSLDAIDYDEKDTFIFRISSKEPKVLWSQHLKKRTDPRLPFMNDKVILVPAMGEIISINPDTGGIRWRFGNKDTEGVNFTKISVLNFTVHAEGTKRTVDGESTMKYEISIGDGKLIPPKNPIKPL